MIATVRMAKDARRRAVAEADMGTIDQTRRVEVRRDIRPLPAEVRDWFPAEITAASDALDAALTRRTEREQAAEEADDALVAAREEERAAEERAAIAGGPLGVSKSAKVRAAAEEAWRLVHASDRVAAEATVAFRAALRDEAAAVHEAIGSRAAVVARAGASALDDVETAAGDLIRLGRLRTSLCPAGGYDPVDPDRAWHADMPRDGRLDAVATLRAHIG